MQRDLEISREGFSAEAGGSFTFVGSRGVVWKGPCLTIDCGEHDRFSAHCVVAQGPREWVGLPIEVYGPYGGVTLFVQPRGCCNSRAKAEETAQLQARTGADVYE